MIDPVGAEAVHPVQTSDRPIPDAFPRRVPSPVRISRHFHRARFYALFLGGGEGSAFPGMIFLITGHSFLRFLRYLSVCIPGIMYPTIQVDSLSTGEIPSLCALSYPSPPYTPVVV